MSAKPTADKLFQDEWPRGGRPAPLPQHELPFRTFGGWAQVTLLRFTGEIDDVPRVYYVLDGTLLLPDRSAQHSRELVEVCCDADAQYRAIAKLELYRHTLQGWVDDGVQMAVRVPVAQAGTGDVLAQEPQGETGDPMRFEASRPFTKKTMDALGRALVRDLHRYCGGLTDEELAQED